MDNLTVLGQFFQGLGVFFLGLGMFWFVSIYKEKGK